MFTRIVKMEFAPENISEFLHNFEEVKEKIRAFEGCLLLELYQDKRRPEIFFTYSRWINEEALDAYRSSNLFNEVWGRTKPLFQSKAVAWSVDTLYRLN